MTSLFVYGTLMPGRLRWPILAPFAQGHRPADVDGRLYDSGNGWPVAVFGTGGVVPGVLVDLLPERLDEALPILDAVEDTATDTLRRIIVTTLDGAAGMGVPPRPRHGRLRAHRAMGRSGRALTV